MEEGVLFLAHDGRALEPEERVVEGGVLFVLFLALVLAAPAAAFGFVAAFAFVPAVLGMNPVE